MSPGIVDHPAVCELRINETEFEYVMPAVYRRTP